MKGIKGFSWIMHFKKKKKKENHMFVNKENICYRIEYKKN